jgi:CO/xanthine dehydrogenase Mo-binding subunit
MARLIRTEKEVEGRYEEVWLVVEEDGLDQWPAGPGDVVGRPAVRQTGHLRARGQAVYTADLQLHGMLHAAVLRSPHPHAHVRRIDLAPALAQPGVHLAIGPGDIPSLCSDAGYEGAGVAAVCADTRAQAIAAVAAIEVEWEVREPLLDPDEAVARESFIGEPRTRSRGDYERALAEADVVLTGEFRTQVVVHNSLETHQAAAQWVGDTLEIYISTQYIWGVRAEVAGELGIPEDKVRVICHYMGGGFGSKNDPGDYTFIAIELAQRTGRPVHCALSRREESVIAGNRNATIQRLTIGARSDGTITALGGEYVNAVG